VTVRVVLADDQALVRSAFALLIDVAPDIEVVGEAANGREAVDLARANRADVVVMDLRMPVLDGIAATAEIVAARDLEHVRVLVLTTFETDDNVFAALRAGASGFLAKDTRPADLLAAIRTVAAGDALLSPMATRVLIGQYLEGSGGTTTPERIAVLTDREREVLALTATGLTNQEIAEVLVLSPLTTKTHVSRILTKLGARDRAQLVVIAYESGLVRPGSTARQPPIR
jgi:DNA-binding NarL/FixJ family response regulator